MSRNFYDRFFHPWLSVVFSSTENDFAELSAYIEGSGPQSLEGGIQQGLLQVREALQSRAVELEEQAFKETLLSQTRDDLERLLER